MPQWRLLILMLFVSCFSFVAFAKDATVFDVRRPFAMENNETPPKDYYINAGSNDGLKVGMLITVNRRQSLYDAYQNKSPGDLVVAIGQLKIIHVQNEISVARLESIISRENLPTVEYDAIMVGDKVDMGTAKMAPQKTASLDAPNVSNPALTSPENPANSKDFSSVAPQAPLTTGAPM